VKHATVGRLFRQRRHVEGNTMSHPSTLISAPPFTLPNQKGQPTSLASLLEKGPVLLAFHRGTW
jgi:cytochrome oxidase Cu insertion factor (SCO1/SenC/PrrC family)